MNDDHSGDEAIERRFEAGPGGPQADNESKAFLNLRDQVRRATPVHPPSDPAADQRRRSAFVRLLLSQFTGQQYPAPGDPSGGAGSIAADEMLGGPRDADASESSNPVSAAQIERTSSTGSSDFGPHSRMPSARSIPLPWDRPLASLGGSLASLGAGGFSMPDVLPTALPSPAPPAWSSTTSSDLPTALPDGLKDFTEPWLAAASQASNRSPSHDVGHPRAPGSKLQAGINETLSASDQPSALESFGTAGGLAMDDVAASAPAVDSEGTAADEESPGQLQSALPDDALSTQLSAPVEALATGLAASPSVSSPSRSDALWASRSMTAADPGPVDPGPVDPGSSDEASEANAASLTMAASEAVGPSSADSSTGSQASPGGGGLSVTVSIRDLDGLMAKIVPADVPASRTAGGDLASDLRDLTQRFNEHLMFEAIKASQMRVINGQV